MKLEQLNEGLRFGKKAIDMVNRERRDILVGIEYEFDLNEEHRDGVDSKQHKEEIDDAAYELASAELRAEIANKIEIIASDDVDARLEEGDVGDLTITIRDLQVFSKKAEFGAEIINSLNSAETQKTAQKMLDEEDIPVELIKEYQLWITQAKEAQILVNEYSSELDDLANWNESGTDIVKEYGTSSKFEYIIDEAEDASANAEEIIGIDLDNKDEVVDMDVNAFENLHDYLNNFDGLQGSDSDWDSDIRYRLGIRVTDEIDSYPEDWLGFDPSVEWETEGWDARIEGFVEQVRNSGDYDSGDIVEIGKNLLQDELSQQDFDRISEVVPDPSVPEGIEVVSKAIPINDQMDLMDGMFQFIRDNGSTDDHTGMHVNMSIRGLGFKKNDMNAVKLAMLADEEFMQSDTKYPPRSHVSRMFENVIAADMMAMAIMYNRGGMEDVVEAFEVIGGLNNKSQGINMGGRVLSNPKERRIEFRFFGGEDYEDEDKTEQTKKDIHKLAYAMMVAYSPTFGNREYYTALLKRLDKLVRDLLPTGSSSFIDLARNIKSGKVDPKTTILRSGRSGRSVFHDLIDDYPN